MVDTSADVDAETTKLAGLVTTALADVLAEIAALKAGQSTGQDLTPQVNNLIALEAPLQQLDAAAKAAVAPVTPPAPPAAS